MNIISDERLWAGIQDGNADMFQELYSRYIIQMSNQAFKLLQDKELTKDLMQEVFLSLYQKKHLLSRNINVGAYLTTTVKNKSLNLLRSIKLKHHHHQLMKDILEHTEGNSPFEASELRMQLNHSLDELKGKGKEVFFLRHFENKSHKEIGVQLGISSRTVEKHISKATQLLKEKMGEEWIR